jgi:hypothetical protein
MSQIKDVTNFIRQACVMQDATSTEDYIGMSMAWYYSWDLSKRTKKLEEANLHQIIAFVRNKVVSYRTQPAMFANGNEALNAQFIDRQVSLLIKNQKNMTPEEFYIALMEIHPWNDGNGRVGELVYNFLNGTLDNPIHPPQYYKWS